MSSWYPLLSSTTCLWSDVLLALPPLWSWEMVPFMVDRLWRAVPIACCGRVNISFTHACTIKNSSSDIVFKSSLGHLSRPGALPGFRQYPAYLAISWLVSATRNLISEQEEWQEPGTGAVLGGADDTVFVSYKSLAHTHTHTKNDDSTPRSQI